VAVTERTIAPIFTGDRQIDTFSRETREAVADIYTQIEASSSSRAMPVTEQHYAYWPLDDAYGETVLRQTVSGGPAPLVCSSSALPGCLGPTGTRVLRMYEDVTVANRLAAVSPSTPTMSGTTIAFWCNLGRQQGANTSLFTWRDSVASDLVGIYDSYVAAGQHVMVYRVDVGGVNYTATAPGEAWFAPGTWHHVGFTYDGETLVGYVDGNGITSNSTPSGAISWSTGAGTKSWRLGTSAADGQSGFYREIHVIKGAVGSEWFEEAYLRGIDEWTGAIPDGGP
jgi:hypothetical protein